MPRPRAQGVESSISSNISTEIARATAAENAKVSKAGDTITGFLTLNANPTANLHAATKQYVDAADSALTTSISNEKAARQSAETAIQNCINAKADKVSGAVNGHFAALDANGNLTDSGKQTSDFQPANIMSMNVLITAQTEQLEFNPQYQFVVQTANATIRLPSAVGRTGRVYVIKGSAGTWAIRPHVGSGQTIDGLSELFPIGVNTTYTLISDGSNWRIIGKHN